MPLDYTTTRLLARIRKRAGLPPWGEDGLDDELLERANDEQRVYLTSLLVGAKQQYKQTYLDITVDGSLRYDIPERAIAAGIKKLEGVDSAGNRWFYAEELDGNFAMWRAGDFYVEANQVVFLRPPTQGTLRVTYSRRLSELVKVAASGTNYGAVQITNVVNATQFTFSLATAGDTPGNSPWDLVKGTPHFDILAMDVSGSELSGTVTVPAGLPSGLAAGDYLCAAGLSPVCQAPLELHPLLAQQTAFSYLDDKGDENAATAERRRDRMEADVKKLIAERVEEGRLLVNPNGPGWGPFRRRWRGSGAAP